MPKKKNVEKSATKSELVVKSDLAIKYENAYNYVMAKLSPEERDKILIDINGTESNAMVKEVTKLVEE